MIFWGVNSNSISICMKRKGVSIRFIISVGSCTKNTHIRKCRRSEKYVIRTFNSAAPSMFTSLYFLFIPENGPWGQSDSSELPDYPPSHADPGGPARSGETEDCPPWVQCKRERERERQTERQTDRVKEGETDRS